MSLSYIHQFTPGSDPEAPPLLLLHGTGGNEHDLVPLGHAISPGSSLLSPRGNVSEHGAARFFSRQGEGIFDPAEVRQRTVELADFISAAATDYGITLTRLIAVGFSNGANIAATLLLLRPVVLAGAVLFRPMVVLDSAAPPRSLDGKRVLIASGSEDPLVGADHPHRLGSHLRAGGAEVSLLTQRAGHSLTSADITSGQEWFKTLRAAPLTH